MEGGHKAIVPTLVMLEVITVIRCRVIQNQDFKGVDIKTTQKIQAESKKKVDEFIAKILGLSKQGKVIIKDPDMKLEDYLIKSLGILQLHTGKIAIKDFCFVCQQKISQRYKFFALGHYDLQHAINAKELAVNEFITFDRAFELLNSITEFKSINVKVLSNKHSG